MTTARDIVSEALRESGILALGEVPEAAALDEGVTRLNALLRVLLGTEIGERLTPVPIGQKGLLTSEAKNADLLSEIQSSYLPSNTQLHARLGSAQTIYLDPNPEDGARIAVLDLAGNFGTNNLTLNANGKKIEDAASVVLSTAGTNTEWFYRQDTGNWFKVTDLTANDPSPFPQEFDDYLIMSLAMRLNHRYGEETRPEVVRYLNQVRSTFRARYNQTRQIESEYALQKLTTRTDWALSDFAFQKGRPWNY